MRKAPAHNKNKSLRFNECPAIEIPVDPLPEPVVDNPSKPVSKVATPTSSSKRISEFSISNRYSESTNRRDMPSP